MKPSNLINEVFRKGDNMTEFEKKLLYKHVINVLTSAVATNLIISINNKRRQDSSTGYTDDGLPQAANAATGAGSVPSYHGEPTLDQRNADDVALDDTEFGLKMTEDAGHEVSVRPERVAEICDGIRFTLYEEMFSFTDVEKPEALYHHIYRDPPNWDQPMGLDFNLKFRIQNAGRINESRAEAVAKEDNESVEFVKEVMKEDSMRNATRLIQITPEVIKTAEGFHSAASKYTRDAFSDLPIDMQIRLGGALAQKLDNEYKRLYGVRIRSGSLVVQDQMNIIKENRAVVTKWVDEATKILNMQSQSTRSVQ